MKLKFTLDTNCICAVDDKDTRPQDAANVLRLVQAHREGLVDVAVTAISASERQRNGIPIDDFRDFQIRLVSLGLGGLPIIRPIFYWDITFWDMSYMVEHDQDEMSLLEDNIQAILFPSIATSFESYCPNGSSNEDRSRFLKIWLNAKCDVLAIWAHLWAKRDVFVTTDKNFHKPAKKTALTALGSGQILSLEEAVLLL
jgi:hypothetical protein